MTYSDPTPEMLALTDVARTQEAEIEDDEVRECWRLIVQAARNGWLMPDGDLSPAAMADRLERGDGMTVQEYWIDVDQETGDPTRAVVGFVDEERSCSRANLVAELRRLDGAYRGQTPEDPIAGDNSVDADETSAPDELAQALKQMLARMAGDEGTALPADVRREAQAALAAFDAGKPTPQLAQAIHRLKDEDRETIEEALRTFGSWMQQPTHDGGAAVDKVIGVLEATLGRWLVRGKRADEKARDDRIARSAREAIARRLEGPATDDPSDSPAS